MSTGDCALSDLCDCALSDLCGQCPQVTVSTGDCALSDLTCGLCDLVTMSQSLSADPQVVFTHCAVTKSLSDR